MALWLMADLERLDRGSGLDSHIERPRGVYPFGVHVLHRL